MGTPERKSARGQGDRGVGPTSHKQASLGRRLIDYVGSLTITQGQGAGEPFRVLPWQRRFIRGSFDRPGNTAALSVARGNGKTTLCAAIADAVLRGPLNQPRAEVVCVASSFDQGRIIFDHVMAFGGYNEDRARWRVQDTANRASIECRDTGARIRCIGSDPRRMMGMVPFLILADEPNSWEPAKADRAYIALRTSLGKIAGCRMVALGTRPTEPDHWFGRMLRDPDTYAQEHTARPVDPPFQRRTWRRANPSMDAMPNIEATIRQEAALARRDDSMLAGFRALRLNLGGDDTLQSTLLDATTWERIEVPAGEHRGPMVLGVDLGQSAAMSAVAAYWPQTGTLEAVACFPELPTLQERGLADGVGRRYVDMAARRELFVAGERVSDTAALLAEARHRWGDPAVIAADRFKDQELLQVLGRSQFPLTNVSFRGQGFKDGAEDVRRFRARCLNNQVSPVRSLLMRSAIGGARVVLDASGNSKLAKATQGGRRLFTRDDAAAAAILAVAEGDRRTREHEVETAETMIVG